MAEKTEYTDELLSAIYSLGILYLEMGYFTPAEKIFLGLNSIDSTKTPASLGLGVIKLEQNLQQESANFFRMASDTDKYSVIGKIGMAFSFLASGEFARALSIIGEIKSENEITNFPAEQRALIEAISDRCQSTQVTTYEN